MHRFLLTPRWWGINVFAVLAVPFCLVLGVWQLGRFEDRVDNHRAQEQRAAESGRERPAELATLLPPTTETVGRTATVTGTYDAREQLLVPDRVLDGERGFYVLTPLLPRDGGAAVPVVRGWLPGDPDPAAVPAPPAGPVTVTGALQAAESPRAVNARSGLPTGQVAVIGAASLINLLPYEVINGFVTEREAAGPLRPVPPQAAGGTGLDLKAFQNLGYTAEWFVFAAFVVFMWFRLYRRELEVRRDAELGILPDPRDAPGPPVPARGSPAP
ncbi:SURF1 family protein [Streptomyces aidingensis]|uniref:SURF1-like protein n=1 Tax=Streptomyces aidingensis TaxID=910347 RepID=A0A1I1KAY6_9ACTN|nr:SURF1 family protein [Streptomyces aidingensis]SFC57492.1 Cytochrome oxidase assembly protein ShyY1 [Streptomyces aidingensis]